MAKRCLIAILALLWALSSASAERPLVIRNVTIITGNESAPRAGMSVLIMNGQIKKITSFSHLRIPANAQTLDAQGKFLIPGLWNMHVHLGAYADGKRALADYLANGITGVRDMGSPLEDILRLRKETADGTIIGPDMVVAGPIVQGPLPFKQPVFISVNDTAEARQTIDMLHASGVDFIKVQDAIPHNIFLAVAEQAHKDGLTFVGHIPPTVLPEEASDLGQHSIEHMGGRFWGVLIGSSKEEAALHAEEVQFYKDILKALDQHSPPPMANMHAAFTKRLIESYDDTKAAALIARFKKNDTWLCPTLVALHTLWEGDAQYSKEDLLWADKVIAKNTSLVPLMQRQGVGLLAGTDLSPNAKGGTIQDELVALVDAGLTPMQALQTATIQPAKFLKRTRRDGTVEAGKVANLVLLEANPLDDIHNTTRIAAVILHGRIVAPPQLLK